MPKGKPWIVEEEKQLKELVDAGHSLAVIAEKMGKSCESVRQKMRKLGLEEQQQNSSVRFCSSEIKLPVDLPSTRRSIEDFSLEAFCVAGRYFPLKTGTADYMLFVDRKAVRVVEAKPKGTVSSGVSDQSEKYLQGRKKSISRYRIG
jgi:hypothetical protein